MRRLTQTADDAFGVAAVLDARLDAGSSEPVAIALSGGGDSLALLHLAAAWTSRVGRPLLALTVDHRLHPDSAAWTVRAGRMAQAAGARWRPLVWDGAKPSSGLPAAARHARHRLLAEAAREGGSRVILMAHTADDAAENAAMREAEVPGMGRLRAWAPSPVWPQGRGVALFRPLLHARRAELRGWLTLRGLAWIDDPANADLSHPRIRARRQLVSVDRAGADKPMSPPLFAADEAGTVRASRTALTHTPSPVVLPQLAAALACAGGAAGPVRGRVCADLLARVRSGAPIRANAGGAALVARGDAVTLTREPPRRGRAAACDPAWVRGRLDLALGRAATEAQLAS